jgi:hypothetical protein
MQVKVELNVNLKMIHNSKSGQGNKCVSYDHDHPDHRSFALILRRTGHLRLKVIEALSTTRFLQRGQVGIILILGFTKLQQTKPLKRAGPWRRAWSSLSKTTSPS